uniref:Uncharacterized protein n=1 Tax=Cacopsylla melanoneura TaxID=428564 RepID=A0A8D9BPQ2_9HEMI
MILDSETTPRNGLSSLTTSCQHHWIVQSTGRSTSSVTRVPLICHHTPDICPGTKCTVLTSFSPCSLWFTLLSSCSQCAVVALGRPRKVPIWRRRKIEFHWYQWK